ncbi:MAG: 30S ribosomal protein S15 [bacterium]
MARMYSRRKGKSGSTRPSSPQKPGWAPIKGKEIEMLVVKLAKEGKKPSVIGTLLRDIYGIPSVKLITKKTIHDILKEKQVLPEIPEDLMALMRRSVLIRKHLAENKKDMTAKRGLQLTESKIGRLVRYYKTTKKLPQDWKYDPEKIKLVVQ